MVNANLIVATTHNKGPINVAVRRAAQSFIKNGIVNDYQTTREQANWLDDPRSYPAWVCAGELGLSICLQMSAKAIPQAASMAERFPNVRIILDHGARPVLEVKIAVRPAGSPLSEIMVV